MTLSEPTRRERKKDETRRRIFDAAIALFRERGFEATTVDDITERADVGRGTFFNHFPRKDAVLAFLSEERSREAEENLSLLLEAPEPMRAKLQHIYRHAALAHEGDRELARFVFAEWMKHAFAPTQETDARWHRLIVSMLAQGRERGQMRGELDDSRVESMLSAIYVATVYQWLFCPEDCAGAVADLAAELRTRLDIAIDGLEPGKGGR
jgi:AcrR family transcriptional regulator